jgi:GNAT superfamily N-acetyltransferase
VAEVRIRHVGAGDGEAAREVAAVIAGSWGSTVMVSRGVAHDASQLPAILAECDGIVVGLLTYTVRGDEMEVISLDAVERRQGVGSLLLAAAIDVARWLRLRRLWLVTSNDNFDALRFYQRRGLRLVTVHRGGIDAARRLKPSIPLTGEFGIDLHDEIELEILL